MSSEDRGSESRGLRARLRKSGPSDGQQPAAHDAAWSATPPPGAHWPYFPPKHYLGQLEPSFQAWFQQRWAGASQSDCDFYHTVELSDGRVIPGAWDLRGRELAYYAGTDFAGKRVLEPGPAGGYLTRWMEQQGADVVAFEAGWDIPNDLIPFEGHDMREHQMAIMRHVDRVHNSWWFYHRDQQSQSKMVYANIYDMPGDLGKFDISVFGCILLHLRDPWTALSEAAMRTTDRIIVTDLLEDGADLETNIMRIAPLSRDEITNWWSIHPGAVVSMLRRLGFGNTTITTHSQLHRQGHAMGDEPTEMSLYTVVGERG